MHQALRNFPWVSKASTPESYVLHYIPQPFVCGQRLGMILSKGLVVKQTHAAPGPSTGSLCDFLSPATSDPEATCGHGRNSTILEP